MGDQVTGKGTVLLVDDNPTNLGVLFEYLSDSGLRLLAAQDGQSAIAQINHLKPDIILLDVMMPGIDGFETCRLLKQDPGTTDIPVIFMTALTETVDKVKGFSLGAVDYITKPFQAEEVLARINAHLALQTLQRQLQDQNQQLRKEIRDREQAEQSLRVLLHAVSHDLRNPVTGLLMVLKNLLKSQGNDASNNQSPDSSGGTDRVVVSRPILERMLESGDRQLKLINSLLEAHAMETRGIALTCKSIRLTDLVVSVEHEMRPLLMKNQATLTNRVPSDLPTIQADSSQLWRVFENLISNALKHNPPGLSITIDASLEGDQMRCLVTDNGVGFPEGHGDELFDLYRRGDNARRTHGLGIGLYLCRQIVQAHGGKIGIAPKFGQGAAIWFTLPLKPSSEAQA